MGEANIASAAARGDQAGRRLLGQEPEFRTHWNQTSFAFQHALAGHSQFSLDTLREVAARTLKYPGFTHWQNGQIEINDAWGVNTAPRLTLDETIAGITANNSQAIIKHAEQDEVVGPVLRELLAEIVDMSPQHMREDVTIGESIIFISSPRRITKYHLDLEASYLLQVSGDKTFYVFDHADASLLPQSVLENQCRGNQDAAKLSAERQASATTYALKPGVGAHIPSRAPHWVRNGEEVSVSINLNFEMRSVHHRLRPIHRFNWRLRKLGLAPTPPGRSDALDDAKVLLENAVTGLSQGIAGLVRPAAAGESYPVWRPARTTGSEAKRG